MCVPEMEAVSTPAVQTRSEPAKEPGADQSIPSRDCGSVESSGSRRLSSVDQLIAEDSSVLNGVGAVGRAVISPSQDSRETNRQPALMTPGGLDAFKADLEDQIRFH